MNKISIIIPTYNAEETIIKSIDSILNQRQVNIEIIVIDDGSTDNTKNVLLPLIERNIINYYFKENGGAASARNLGIKMAKGNFIGFLDADDTYLDGMIDECISTLECGGFDLVSVDNYMVYYEGECEIRREIQSYDWIEVAPDVLFCTFLKVGAIGGIHKAFFRRSVFETVGLLDTSLPVYEDLDFWIRIAKKGLKWGHIRKPLLEYNHRGDGTSLFTYSNKRNLECRLRLLRRYKKESILRNPGMSAVIGEQLWNFGRKYMLEFNSYFKALICFSESLLTDLNIRRPFASFLSRVTVMFGKD